MQHINKLFSLSARGAGFKKFHCLLMCAAINPAQPLLQFSVGVGAWPFGKWLQLRIDFQHTPSLPPCSPFKYISAVLCFLLSDAFLSFFSLLFFVPHSLLFSFGRRLSRLSWQAGRGQAEGRGRLLPARLEHLSGIYTLDPICREGGRGRDSAVGCARPAEQTFKLTWPKGVATATAAGQGQGHLFQKLQSVATFS